MVVPKTEQELTAERTGRMKISQNTFTNRRAELYSNMNKEKLLFAWLKIKSEHFSWMMSAEDTANFIRLKTALG